LSPTRELAVQIQKVVLALGDYMNVQCHSCIGKLCMLVLYTVLWILIRKNPKVLAGSESEKSSDSDTELDPDTNIK
jgi:hypothetical protein